MPSDSESAETPKPASAVKPATSLFDKPLFIALASSLISAAVAVASLSFNAYMHEKDGQRAAAKDRAENLKDDIKLVTSQYELLTKPDESGQKLAYSTIRLLQSQHADEHNPNVDKFFTDVFEASTKLASNAKGSDLRAEAAKDTAAKAPRSSTAPVVAPAGPAVQTSTGQLAATDPVNSAKPSLAYIQFYCAKQQGAASAVKAALLNAGVPAPGYENVVAKHPDQAAMLTRLARSEPEVRFFYASDEAAAKFAAKLVGDTLGAPSVYLRNLTGRYGGNIKGGMVEIWLPYSAEICAA